jgi:glycerol-3-phosphate O-acyltransferase
MPARAVVNQLGNVEGTELADRPVVIATPPLTPVEDRKVEEWRRDVVAPGGVERVPLTAEALAGRLQAGDDPFIVPVRVAWLLRERAGSRRIGLGDVLALGNPHRPPAHIQRRIARREPGRCRIVVADGAPAEELRRRWRAEGHHDGDAQAFGTFVQRQGCIALERAERRIIGDRYKVPQLVAEDITDSARFRREADALADRLGRPPREVFAAAKAGLESIVAVQSRLVVDFYLALFRPLHARAWRVEADTASLERLRGLNREHALVFLPTHRSYVDAFVLGGVLANHDFPRNHTLGGNNVAFWPVGPLGRRAGIVWIRRSFADDEPYKLAVREYLGYLLSKRFNLEWYIEGGRSRSGKLRHPRYGLLRFVAQALETGAAEDAILVPVSITYDQLPELSTMVAEEAGTPKKAEGLDWLVRYFRDQWRPAGTTVVRFGDPQSMREGMRGESVETPEGRLALSKTVFEVCVGINDATPILSMSLVTLALLGGHGRALTLYEVRQVLEPLIDYVERRDLPALGLDALRRETGVAGDLDRLGTAGVVTRFDGGTEAVYSIGPGQHHVAAYYRNSAVHWFVNRAIVEVAMLAVAREASEDPVEEALQVAFALRDLLKHEFFFPEKEAYRHGLLEETALIEPGWRDRVSTPEAVRGVLVGARPLMAHRILRPFLESYLVVADRLAARDPRTAWDEAAFLVDCKAVGRQWLLQRRIVSPEATSTEVFTNALRLAANRDLIDPGREELRVRRQAFAEEVAQFVTLVADIEALDQRLGT